MLENIPEKKKDLKEIAMSFYNPQFEYHNFDHALGTWEAAREIIKRCRQEGKTINEQIVYYACLFHDAGYHEDERESGFGTKEDYAAAIAKKELTKHGVVSDIIEAVNRAIKGTEQEYDISNLSIEGMIVRVADLADLAADYAIFLENNRKLKQEQERILQRPIEREIWKMKTKEIMEFYLSQKIQLTHGYADKHGESIFHKRTKENLERFLKE